MSLLETKIESSRKLDATTTMMSDEKIRQLCELEIRALHATFVTWFRGEQPMERLRNDLQQRMLPEFSHIAPNGHMVQGRDVLLQYLVDKYGCYGDRIFSIDVYNVEVLWCKKNLCLVSYEEWQSWEDNTTSSSAAGADHSESGSSAGGGKQQFGRLSTCLLEQDKGGIYHWVHVHETWMENEEPIIRKPTSSTTAAAAAMDDETVMTGPILPREATNSNNSNNIRTLPTQQRSVSLRGANTLNNVLIPSQDDDDDEDESMNMTSLERPIQTPAPESKPEVVAAVPMTRAANGPNDSMDGEDDEDYDDDEDDFEEDEEPPKPPPPKLTPDEQKFLEASQGILVFEEDEDTAVSTVASVSQRKLASNGITLDDLIETDRLAGSKADDVLNDPAQLSANLVNNSSQAMLSLHSAADASHKRHVSPNLAQYAVPLKWDDALVGISISGFDIGTSQGPIANAEWYNLTTESLEGLSQPTSISGGQKRKIILPEMVFPIAHVALEGHGLWLSWDATDCLKEWALSHSHIPINAKPDQGHNGVSIMKTKDAKIWEDRIRQQQQKIGMKDAASVFHYDWTYSSPFAGKMEGGAWVEIEESGMRMDLLTDQSAPILFFDEIVLYEDDLHDNGTVQYSIKLRIMPTCAYILARLWVRVDQVLVRLKETRVLVDFFGLQPQVYRDIVWRSCPWDQLAAHGLPTSVTAWSCENGETAEWHGLLQRLPEETLPNDTIQHAVLEYGKSAS